MSELTYVFTVEAFIIGLCNIQLVAQRWNVFTWSFGNSWPVLGTTILILLAYGEALLILACLIKASNLTSLSLEVCEGLGRSVGRLSTISMLFITYMSILVFASPKVDWPLMLCQMWGTQCREPGSSQIWSFKYAYYLALLLPCIVCQAVLQLIAGSSCKINKYSPRRIVTLNLVFLFILHASHTLDKNLQLGCESECIVVQNATMFNATPGAVYVRSSVPIILGFVLLGLDLIADVTAGIALFHDKISVLVFITVRLLQIGAMPMTVFVLEFDLYYTLAWIHFGLTCVCGCLDIVDVVLQFEKTESDSPESTSPESEFTDSTLPKGPTQSLFRMPAISEDRAFTDTNSAFTIEPVRRKRFVFSMAHRSRWPIKPRRLEANKKQS